MYCSPLDAPFGARRHLDADRPVDEVGRAELRRLFAEHGLLLARGEEISREPRRWPPMGLDITPHPRTLSQNAA